MNSMNGKIPSDEYLINTGGSKCVINRISEEKVTTFLVRNWNKEDGGPNYL